MFAASPALADAKPRTVLIESYVGGRPRDAGPVVEQVREGLAAQVLSGDRLRAWIESEYARPISVASPQAMERLVNRGAEGSAAFEAADFIPATAALSQVSEGLAKESAALSLDPKLREARKNALITLALAYAKMRRFDAAKETLAELVRSFSDIRSFPESAYPPKIAELGNQLLKEKAERGGALSVATIPSGRKLFLNEEPMGASPKLLSGLLPGKYRLYMPSAHSDQSGSVRIVTIDAGRRRSLLLATEVDDHLELSEYVGFKFAGDDEKQRFEIPLASAMGQALGVNEVVLITQGYSPSAEPELLGAVYEVGDGHRAWGVILPLTPAPNDKAVASFVLSLRTRREIAGVKLFDAHTLARPAPPEEEPPAKVEPAPRKAERAMSRDEPRRDGKWIGLQALGWTVFVAGVPTFLAGISLMARTGLGTCESTTQLCPTVYSDKTASTVLLAFGAAAVVDTPMYMVLHDDYYRQLRNYGIAAIVQGATAMASGGLLLYYDQMPKRFTTDPNTNQVVKVTSGYESWAWASFGLGAATAATGIALTIADRYFHARDTRSWDKPLVAVSLTGTGISVAGRF
jgi:hypothetical protein